MEAIERDMIGDVRDVKGDLKNPGDIKDKPKDIKIMIPPSLASPIHSLSPSSFINLQIHSNSNPNTLIPKLPSLNSSPISPSFKKSPTSLVPLPEDVIKIEHLSSLSKFDVIIDIRPFNNFSSSHIKNAVNICIPTTLLKRSSLDLPHLLNLVNIPSESKALLLSKSSIMNVLIYDSSSTEGNIALNLYQTILKFHQYKSFNIHYLDGGFQNTNAHTSPQKSTSSRSLSSLAPSPISFSADSYDLIEYSQEPDSASSVDSMHNYSTESPHYLSGFKLPSQTNYKVKFVNSIKKNLLFNLDEDYSYKFKFPIDFDSNVIGDLKFFPNWLGFMVKKENNQIISNLLEKFTKVEKLEKLRLNFLVKETQKSLGVHSPRTPRTPLHAHKSPHSPHNRLHVPSPDVNLPHHSHTHSMDFDAPQHSHNTITGNSQMHSPISLSSNTLHLQTENQPMCSPSGLCPECDDINYKMPKGIEYGFKNRYNNIWPYEHSRVKLQNNDDDYFNANFINCRSMLASDFTYIATQNPLKDTVDDFWQIINNEEIKIIISLDNSALLYLNGVSDVEVISRSESTVVRKINQSIYHFEFKVWPDFGVPKDFDSLMQLIQFKNSLYFNNHVAKRHNKILVHCSAGCGRTGVFITVDNLINSFNSDRKLFLTGDDDMIYKLIQYQRRQRISMVQNLDQYIVCYEILLFYLTNVERYRADTPLKLNNLKIEGKGVDVSDDYFLGLKGQSKSVKSN